MRVTWEVVPDNPPEYCGTSEFFDRDWESETDTLGSGPTCAERVLAAAAMVLEPRGKACKGVLEESATGRRVGRPLRTIKQILPRRTTVQVQGDTSSRSADVEKDLLE